MAQSTFVTYVATLVLTPPDGMLQIQEEVFHEALAALASKLFAVKVDGEELGQQLLARGIVRVCPLDALETPVEAEPWDRFAVLVQDASALDSYVRAFAKQAGLSPELQRMEPTD